MNAVELKSDLHNLIDKASDLTILQAVRVILEKETGKNSDLADNISDEL